MTQLEEGDRAISLNAVKDLFCRICMESNLCYRSEETCEDLKLFDKLPSVNPQPKTGQRYPTQQIKTQHIESVESGGEEQNIKEGRMDIMIRIANSNIPKHQGIVDISLSFMDGKVTDAHGYGFFQLEPHGRLGDLDALEKDVINGIRAGNYEDGYEQYGHINNMDDCIEAIRFADTILEATEEE